jgi:hypothetical protein
MKMKKVLRYYVVGLPSIGVVSPEYRTLTRARAEAKRLDGGYGAARTRGHKVYEVTRREVR